MTCQPYVHEYNRDMLTLYGTCGDQLISGPGGAVGLDDRAIGYAMDTYFEVDDQEKLGFSLLVRDFCQKILKEQRERTKDK